MFFKIGVLKNLAIFTGKHVLEYLFNKVTSLKAYIFILKETPTQTNIVKFLRAIFFTKNLRWLLLEPVPSVKRRIKSPFIDKLRF